MNFSVLVASPHIELTDSPFVFFPTSKIVIGLSLISNIERVIDQSRITGKWPSGQKQTVSEQMVADVLKVILKNTKLCTLTRGPARGRKYVTT